MENSFHLTDKITENTIDKIEKLNGKYDKFLKCRYCRMWNGDEYAEEAICIMYGEIGMVTPKDALCSMMELDKSREGWR